MRARGSQVAAGLALLALLAVRAVPATADARPEVVAAIGGTAAVQGAQGSGVSASLTLQWPLADHVRFGLTGFLDDLGDRTGRLRDPSGQDLGPTSLLHQSARGGAWRTEAYTALGRRYEGFATMDWGVYRVRDDVRGTLVRRTNAPGVAVGAGVTRAVTATHAIGLELRYQQLWRGVVQRYLSAAAEWRWRRSEGN
jgi:opacity protein-like surface antigen